MRSSGWGYYPANNIFSCRVVSCRVASCRVASGRVVSRRVVSCRVGSCRVVSPRVASCRVVSRLSIRLAARTLRATRRRMQRSRANAEAALSLAGHVCAVRDSAAYDRPLICGRGGQTYAYPEIVHIHDVRQICIILLCPDSDLSQSFRIVLLCPPRDPWPSLIRLPTGH